MLNGNEPVSPDEIIYRRVLKGSAYRPQRDPPLSQKAFSPRPIDTDGLSIIRRNYVDGPVDAASLGQAGYDFYVIAFLAADMTGIGMNLVPDPNSNCLGHALIRTINFGNKDHPAVQAMMDRARHLPFDAHGPFPGMAEAEPFASAAT